MFKMEKLNVVRYVETEKEKQNLIEQGYVEVEESPEIEEIADIEETPETTEDDEVTEGPEIEEAIKKPATKRGGKNGTDKS